MALLSGIVIPLSEMNIQREKERELNRALWEIRNAIDEYAKARRQGAVAAVDISGSPYPPNLHALVQSTPDTRAGYQGQILHFLRRIPRDPFADANLPPERTWGLRSYQSEAASPQPGIDVYDVYSKSNRIGLNGVPLREW